MENIVALALMKRYGNKELYYYNKNIEVDFYLPSQKMAIQASFSLSEIAHYKLERLRKATETVSMIINTTISKIEE